MQLFCSFTVVAICGFQLSQVSLNFFLLFCRSLYEFFIFGSSLVLLICREKVAFLCEQTGSFGAEFFCFLLEENKHFCCVRFFL